MYDFIYWICVFVKVIFLFPRFFVSSPPFSMSFLIIHTFLSQFPSTRETKRIIIDIITTTTSIPFFNDDAHWINLFHFFFVRFLILSSVSFTRNYTPKAKDDLHLHESKTVLFATRRVRLVPSRHRPISITMTTNDNDNNNERIHDKKIKEQDVTTTTKSTSKFGQNLRLNNERIEFQV